MSCREALEQLDALPPGDFDLPDAEFDAANRHLAECDDCQTTFRVRRDLDLRIAETVRDIAVPADLKDSILAALQADASPVETAVSEDIQTQKPALQARRWWLVTALGVTAACTLLGVFFWGKPPVEEPGLTLADLRRDTTLDLSGLDDFDGRFQVSPPSGNWRIDGIQFDKQPKGDFREPNGGPHRAALYGFTVARTHGPPVKGVMLVMPRNQLDDLPQESQFTYVDSPENYARRASGTFHAIAWSTDDYVYVCFVPAGGDSLETLTKALSPPPV